MDYLLPLTPDFEKKEMMKLQLAIVILYCFLVSASESKGGGVSFTMNMVPVDYYMNRSLTREDALERSLIRTQLRREVFLHQENLLLRSGSDSVFHPTSGDEYGMVVFPRGAYAYVTKIRIGTPPVLVTAYLDTGSSLVWTQCDPCDDCYTQGEPRYNRDRSTTFDSIPCDGIGYCSNAGKFITTGCDAPTKYCTYSTRYYDNKTSRGFFARETFTFFTNGVRESPFELALGFFGCGTAQSEGLFSSRISGVVGLGRSPISLFGQLPNEASAFAYCLLPHYYVSSSRLIFGPDAVPPESEQGNTVFVDFVDRGDEHYYMLLYGISVGDMTYISEKGYPSMVLDSGSTATYLEPSLYSIVLDALKKMIHVNPSNATMSNKQITVCYETNDPSKDLPSMIFHFQSGRLELGPQNIFYDNKDQGISCLFILPATKGPSILGSHAQVNLWVSYELAQNQRASFTPYDCSRF